MGCFDRYCGKCGTKLEDCGHTNAGDYHLKSLGCPECNMRYEMDSRRDPEWEPYSPLNNPRCCLAHKNCNFKGIRLSVENCEILKTAEETKYYTSRKAHEEYMEKCRKAQEVFDETWEKIVTRNCGKACER
jgi:hypothetical protein